MSKRGGYACLGFIDEATGAAGRDDPFSRHCERYWITTGERELQGGMYMERNVGTIDRIVRCVAAVFFIAASLIGWITGIAGIVLSVIAGMLLSSVISGYCPLYVKLGIKKTW